MVFAPSINVPVIPPPELAQLAAAAPLFKLAAVTVKGVPFEQKTVASVAVAEIGPGWEGSMVKDTLPAVPALQTPFTAPETATVGCIWAAIPLLAPAAIMTKAEMTAADFRLNVAKVHSF
jgi:hypothetical protein